jgi:hypothetical protein
MMEDGALVVMGIQVKRLNSVQGYWFNRYTSRSLLTLAKRLKFARTLAPKILPSNKKRPRFLGLYESWSNPD